MSSPWITHKETWREEHRQRKGERQGKVRNITKVGEGLMWSNLNFLKYVEKERFVNVLTT